MAEKILGIGILGCGNVARIHAEAIMKVPQFRLVSVCSQSGKSAEAFAGQYAVPANTALDEFLRDESLQAVAICTPSGTHADLGIAAAGAGKHILMEKPIDVSLEKADSLIAACRAAGVKLAIALQSRFLDGPKQLKNAVEHGKLGKLIMAGAHIKWYRTPAYYASAAWRGTLALDGGGVAINQAIHTIDLLQWIAGPVNRVEALSSHSLHASIEGEDTIVAALRFGNGALGMIEAATSAYPGFKRRIEITGTEGTLVLEGDNVSVWALKDGSPNPGVAKADVSDGSANPMAIDCEGHRRVMEDFALSILEDREPQINGVEGRKSLELVRRLYESAETNS
jgi:UDP-N-acetyl-2-amino-2-deoxyglucuronate dehydrogenase